MMNSSRERVETAWMPEASVLIEAYFSRVHGALFVAAAEECGEAVEDLRAYVLEALEGGPGTPADVTRVLAELGPPETLAARYADGATDEPSISRRTDRSRLAGSLFGMPYDLRIPTPARVATRWWDPSNPQVIVPRVFGVGWTVNYGALAVKFGLVRPDDEDVPFGQVPVRWLLLALAIPLILLAGFGLLVALFQSGLPAQVATHYGPGGVADGFSSKGTALVLPASMALFGFVMAVWAWIRNRPPLSKVAAGALSTMLTGVSAGVYGQSVAHAQGATGLTVLLPSLAGAIALPFVLLVVLSRVGRAEEQRHDLERTPKKGSV